MLTKNAKLYIAGPMSNIKAFNVPAFLEAQKELKAKGYRVQLPADLDDPAIVKSLLASPDGAHNPEDTGGLTWGDCLALDVKLIADHVDGIAVLPGWQRSRGARLEAFCAQLCGKPVVYQSSLRKVPAVELEKAFASVIL